VGENTNQIERDIVEERAALGRNLDALEQKAKDLADWRVHYRNHPAVFLSAAVGAGVLLGALAGGRISLPGEESWPSESSDANGARPATPGWETRRRRRQFDLKSLMEGPKGRELADTWQHLTGALLGVGITKLIDAVSDRIPGFRDQYETHSHRPASASSYANASNRGNHAYSEWERDGR
jgi:hypothetical protein